MGGTLPRVVVHPECCNDLTDYHNPRMLTLPAHYADMHRRMAQCEYPDKVGLAYL